MSLILRCPLRPLGILFLFSTNLWRAWTFFLEDSFSSNCAFWRNIYVLWLRGGESTMYILKKIHFSVKRFLRLYQRKFVLDLQFFFCCIPNLTQRVLERGGADWILLKLRLRPSTMKKSNETRRFYILKIFSRTIELVSSFKLETHSSEPLNQYHILN